MNLPAWRDHPPPPTGDQAGNPPALVIGILEAGIRRPDAGGAHPTPNAPGTGQIREGHLPMVNSEIEALPDRPTGGETLEAVIHRLGFPSPDDVIEAFGNGVAGSDEIVRRPDERENPP